MESTARVAVVIPTHDRRDRLRALLSSLATSSNVALGRVIVVDDSARPTVRREEFPELDLRVVHLEERRFIAYARNRGLREVDEEFVLLVDDDNVVSESTFVRPLADLVRDRSVAAVMPSVLYRAQPDLVWVYACPFNRGRWGFELVGRNRPRDPSLENRLLETDALPNAAFFRRDDLRSVAGFDERLPMGATADLCQRLKGAGHGAVADTGAFTLHDVEPPGTTAFWGAHSNDAARTVLEKREWYLLQRRIHPEAEWFTVRALWHSWPFLASSSLAYLLRRDTRTVPLLLATARGVLAGLRDAGRERGAVTGYNPAG